MGLFSKETPPAETPNDAAPVTRGEFSALIDKIGDLATAVKESNSRPVVVQAAAAPEPPAELDVSDEEIESAIAEGGKGAASRIKAAMDRRLNAARREVSREVEAVKNYGTTMLGSLAEKTFANGLSPRDRAIFARYEGEVKKLVSQSGADLAGHMDTWGAAFKYVKGDHEEQLQNEHVEATLRQRAEDEEHTRTAALPGAGGRPATTPEHEPIPTLADLAAGHPALEGIDETEFLRRMNKGRPKATRFKDWGDYMSRGRALQAQISAIRDGNDDGGEGTMPAALQ